MKIKTSELTGAKLDWAVASCEGWHLCFEAIGKGCIVYKRVGDGGMLEYAVYESGREDNRLAFHLSWAAGGPIIDREGINTALRYTSVPAEALPDVWDAIINPEFYSAGRPGSGVKKEVITTGPTPLVAAMRCYVVSKFGDEVDIPEELL